MSSTIKSIAKRLLAAATAPLPAVGVRVIAYHSIDDSGSPISITRDELDRQLGYIRRRGFRTLTISEYLDRIRGKESSRNELLVTFDDGYDNFLSDAVPLLERHQCRACVFVPTDHVGNKPAWLQRDRERIAKMLRDFSYGAEARDKMLRWSAPLMGWDELREVRRRGFDVESHSAGHHFLGSLNPAELRDDLRRSAEALSGIDFVPRVICYPYGDCNSQVAAAAAETGFQCGFLTTPTTGSDLMQLGRTQIGGDDSTATLQFALSRAASWRRNGRA